MAGGGSNSAIVGMRQSKIAILARAIAVHGQKNTAQRCAVQGENAFTSLWNALGSVTEPMREMSMLQSVEDVFNISTWSKDSRSIQFLTRTGLDYINSLVPTWMGKLARTVDPTRRMAYYESGDPAPYITNSIEQLQNKIPFLSMLNVSSRDNLGRTSEHVIPPFVENFLSPAHFTKIKDGDVVLDELERLVDSSKENDEIDARKLMPPGTDRTLRVDGKPVRLTDKQFNQIHEDQSTTQAQLLSELMQNDYYLAADDTTKAGMVSDVYAYAKRVAQYNFDNRVNLGSTDAWIPAAYQSGKPINAIIRNNLKKNRGRWITHYSEKAIEAMDSGDTQSRDNAFAQLKKAGASNAEIRKVLTAHYKPLYQEAYRMGSEGMETMAEIRGKLNAANVGYSDKDHFIKWQQAVQNKDVEAELNEEEDFDEEWLELNFDEDENED